jgi:AcrR family transcriptional regulator
LPRIVDHEERRREVAAAVLRVVARSGLNGVTMREVAAESGWSTGVLSHYFDSKRHLLHAALVEVSRQAGHHLRTAAGLQRAPLDTLRALLEEMLPLDERRTALCQVFSYFYGEGAAGGSTADELSSYYRVWRHFVCDAIVAGQADGSIRDDVNPELMAEVLVAMADGLGLQATFDMMALPAERQRKHVEALVHFLTPSARRPAGQHLPAPSPPAASTSR